jgi:flagellar hook-associated protein 3 FlgL
LIDRVSTSLLYSLSTRTIQKNQAGVYNLSNKINLGKKFTNPSDDPIGIIGATHVSGRILDNDQSVRDRQMAISDLSAQEVALNNVIDLTDKVYEIAVAAGNDTLSANERLLYRDEMRSMGESIVQLVNSKVGERFIFSGQQSNLQTLRLQDGASFDQAVYKHNQNNGDERTIESAPTSISLEDTLLGAADGAILTNRIINPVTSVASNLDFEVDDGNGNIVNFTVNTSVGDNLATLIASINAAYNGAGGAGVIAQESPNGYLQMNTNLIPGNSPNNSARISVLSSSDTALTNEIGINRQDNFGREIGLLRTLTNLENALLADDAATIRGLIYELQFNLGELNTARSKVGLLVSQAERFNDASEDLNLKLQSDLSQQQDLDMVDATVKLNSLQIALQTSVQTTSNLFSMSLAQFL